MKMLAGLKLFLLFGVTLVVAACGGVNSQDDGNEKVKNYTPLSEAEAKVYITPTVYYIPRYDLSQQSCDSSQKKNIKDKKGNLLFRVCASIYNSCLMQGTCELKTEHGIFLINYFGQVDSEYRFSLVQKRTCRYGFGVSTSVCLDPFYSVAADLSIYKLGQVIYIPSAVGLALPDGTRHDGHFIVRDTGGAIRGHGRFDFFTGFIGNIRSQNPLSQIGFSDKTTHVQYYVLDPSEAQAVLKKRKYPSTPVDN